MTHINSRYIFIFNPAADKGRAARKAKWLQGLVSERADSAMFTTTCAEDAGEIACSEISEGTRLIACGGDGTLHDVVNAVVGSDVTIGILPIGSANDFNKTLNPQNRQYPDISHFFNAETKKVDIGCVSFRGTEQLYFINSLGIGFTGRIAERVKRTFWLKGELAYLYALLRVLVGYSPVKMHIKITHEESVQELHEPVFAFSVLNGKIEGGKFKIAPDADLSDGLLDVCILKAVPKHEFIRYALKYLNGTHINDQKVLYCKAQRVDVTIEGPDVMHIDGEVYDNICGKIVILAVPEGVVMLCDHPVISSIREKS